MSGWSQVGCQVGPPEPLPVAQLSLPRKAGSRTARLMLKHRAGRDRGNTGQEVAGRGTQGVPRVREERLRWWGRVLREGRSPQARAGRGRAGQGGVGQAGSHRSSLKLLQIFIIWGTLFLLFLCLLGSQGGCRGRGGWSSPHKTVPPPREPPSSRPSPSTHRTQSSQWAAAPGTHSHTPGSHLWGQVRRRDSHTRGAGHTEGERAEDTRPRGTEPQKACGHGHTGRGVGWQGQGKGGHGGTGHSPRDASALSSLSGTFT